MKVTKLIIGILQLVLALFIMFQSFAVGMSHAFGNSSGDAGGTAGLFVALLFIASGIIYIVTHKKDGMGGDIAGLILMLIAWIMGIANAHDYSDLQIWGWFAFVIGVGFFIWHLLSRRSKKN